MAWREETWPVVKDRGGPGRLDRLRRRIWPGLKAAQGPHLGAARHHPDGDGDRRQQQARLVGRAHRRQARAASPADLPRAPQPPAARTRARGSPRRTTPGCWTPRTSSSSARSWSSGIYVPRNIIPVLCPAVLCGQRRLAAGVTGGGRLGAAAAGHIMLGLREAASSTPGNREEVVPMLETYFVKPQTVDPIRACWIGAAIERYARWLSEQGYSTRTVLRRVPMLVAFGKFARLRGALVLADLPAHVDGFVAMRVAPYRRGLNAATEVRDAVEQMLAVVLPGFERTGRPRRELPFARAVPGFFDYLAAERGLRPVVVVLPASPGLLRGLPRPDRRRPAAGPVASDPQRVHRRARRGGPGQDDSAERLRGAARVPPLRASPGPAGRRPDQGRGVADSLPAVRHPAIHHLGRGGTGAGGCRAPHPVRQARLRDLAAAGDLRPAGPRGGGPDPGRHRLETRPAGHPRTQGRALHRLPAVSRGRRGPGGLPAAPAGRAAPPTGTCSSGRWRRNGPSAGSRSPRAPSTTCSKPGSRCPAG